MKENQTMVGSRNGRSFNSVRRAFTLIELLVVIAIIAILASMLLPALARAKAQAAKAKCASNEKQLAAAMNLYASDNNEMYPPAGEVPKADPAYEMAWDTYINFYISGGHITYKQFQSWIINNGVPVAYTPQVLRCPADTGPSAGWVQAQADSGYNIGRRTYCMAAGGTNWSVDYQIDAGKYGYAYPPQQDGSVGIYWVDDPAPSVWSVPSLKTSIVPQPSGTFLMAEDPNGNNVANNIWPCIVMGPYSKDSGTGTGEMYQIDPTDPDNQGSALYKNHGAFNYLYCDGHLQSLTTNNPALIGSGTLGAPKGPWTLTPND